MAFLCVFVLVYRDLQISLNILDIILNAVNICVSFLMTSLPEMVMLVLCL